MYSYIKALYTGNQWERLLKKQEIDWDNETEETIASVHADLWFAKLEHNWPKTHYKKRCDV
jgi:hypothetical protein